MSLLARLAAAALAFSLAGSGAVAQPAAGGLACPELKKIVAAAAERPSFASLVKRQGSTLKPLLLPKGFASCFAARFSTPGIKDSYACSLAGGMTKDAAQAALDRLHGQVAACLGVAGTAPAMMDMRGHGQLDYAVQQAGRAVTVSVNGAYWDIDQRSLGFGVYVAGQ